MRKVILFINPESRHGATSLEATRQWLRENHFEILNESECSEDWITTVDRLSGEAEAIVVGGGDGSVNHILPALIKTRLPLLLLPLGTANNLARTLSIPASIPEALTLLREGTVTDIDVGIANGIPFINVVGIGMSASVNRMVAPESKRWLGVFAFAMMAVRVAARMTPFRVTIECDGHRHRGLSWQVTVCNGRNYGNGLTIAEGATLQDHRLHGMSTEIANTKFTKWLHGLELVPSLIAGHFYAKQHVTTFSGREIRISTSRSKHVDVDGDIKTRTPVRIAVINRAIRIYVRSN